MHGGDSVTNRGCFSSQRVKSFTSSSRLPRTSRCGVAQTSPSNFPFDTSPCCTDTPSWVVNFRNVTGAACPAYCCQAMEILVAQLDIVARTCVSQTFVQLPVSSPVCEHSSGKVLTGLQPVSSTALDLMTTSSSICLPSGSDRFSAGGLRKRHAPRCSGVGFHSSRFHLLIVSYLWMTFLQISTVFLTLSVLPRGRPRECRLLASRRPSHFHRADRRRGDFRILSCHRSHVSCLRCSPLVHRFFVPIFAHGLCLICRVARALACSRHTRSHRCGVRWPVSSQRNLCTGRALFGAHVPLRCL